MVAPPRGAELMISADKIMTYWFYNWLDEHGAGSSDDVLRIIDDPGRFEHLLESVDLHQYDSHTEPSSSPYGIVLGAGSDLSLKHACRANHDCSCRIDAFERCLRRLSLYFDEFVMADPVGELMVGFPLDRTDDLMDAFRRYLRQAADIAIRLRSYGAEDSMRFVIKRPVLGRECMDRALAKLGVPNVDALEGEVGRYASQLRRDLEEQLRSVVDFGYGKPLNDDVYELWDDDFGEDAIRSGWPIYDPTYDSAPFWWVNGTFDLRAAVEERTAEVVNSLYEDIGLSDLVRLPLGTSLTAHRRLLSGSTSSAAEILLELQLPLFDDVPISTLMQIRRDQWSYFQRFRIALRSALREARSTTQTPAQAARQVRDYLDSGVQDIDRGLASVRNSTVLQTMLGAAVGIFSISAGLFLREPGVVAGGALGAAQLMTQPIQSALGHLEDPQMHDMYFLWAIQRHQG